ncbi:hypothetical protein [Deinococcus frigens]|uniref:hypothetical protein n=1 Tax=Deinococcus frigens TaxID=249403 RepID=UPI0004951F77|nr:hypothetical protein [Deinococcus frigens]
MVISLRHRAIWILVGGLAGLTLATVLGLRAPWWIVLALLGAGLIAASIAASSSLRHAADPELQAEYTVPDSSQRNDRPR